MNELRRILSNKRRLIILIALPVLAVALFLLERMGGDILRGVSYLSEETRQYREDVQRFAAMTAEEADEDTSELYPFDGRNPITLRSTKLHVAGYADYLEAVSEQAERMSNSSVFGKNKNSFTYRNIQKTARDFEALSGVTPEFGGNRAIERWLDFNIQDALYLFAVLIVILAFFEERRSGLLTLVRSCPSGRKKLALSRLAVLFIWSAAFTVLIYAGTLITAFALYGGTDTLSHAVQSIESFRTCTLRVTIGEWIGLYFAAKLVCGFLIGLIFWFVLSFLSQTQLAWLAIIAILAAEYAAWAFIPSQMALSVFRYVNIFSYIFPAEALGKYVNMNFFGLPVGVLDLLIVLFVLLTAALSIGVVLISVKRYPVGNRNLLGRLIALFNKLADAVRSRLPITAMEGYKQLILGGTALFLVAAVWIAPRLNFMGYSSGSSDEFLYRQYLQEASGPIDEKTYAYIEQAKANIENYQDGMEDFGKALSKLEAQVELRKALADEGGYEPWLLDQSRLDETIGKSSVSIHRWNAIVAAALVILCAAPIFTFEKRAGTEKLLHSTLRGRGFVFIRKYLIILLEVAAIFALVYLRQWIRLVRCLGESTLSSPIQNADILAQSDLRITLGTFIALIFGLRLLALIAVGCFTAFISSRSQSWEKAALTGFALILLPGVLLYFGSEWVGYISIIPGISAVDILVPSSRSAAFAVITAVLMAAAAVLTFLEYRRRSSRLVG